MGGGWRWTEWGDERGVRWNLNYLEEFDSVWSFEKISMEFHEYSKNLINAF